MIKPDWTHHLTHLVAGTALALLIGWWAGHFILIPTIFLIVYFAWQYFNGLRL